MNSVILVGRLARDVETRTTNSGDLVARFTVAVSRRKKGESDFVNCVAFRTQAEFVGKYFSKGKPICVSGEIRTGSYEGKDGKKVYTTDIAVNNVEFVPTERTENDVDGFKALDEEPPF